MDAMALCSQALKTLQPPDIFNFAVDCFQQKRSAPFLLGKAIFLLESKLLGFSKDAKLHALAGSLRFQLGDYSSAKILFQKARQIDPKLSIGSYEIWLHLLEGRPGKVGNTLKKKLQDRAFATKLFEQGKRFLGACEWISAQNIFHQLLWAKSAIPKVSLELGRVLVKQGKFKEAIPYFGKLENAGSYFGEMAVALIETDEASQVELLLKKWIESYQHPTAHKLLALLAERKKDWFRMEGHLLNCLQGYPSQSSALWKLAELEERNGKKQLAQEHQHKAKILEEEQKAFFRRQGSCFSELFLSYNKEDVENQERFKRIHHQGISLYREALHSGKAESWKKVLYFWKMYYADQGYWRECLAWLQQSEPDFTEAKQVSFQARVMEQIISAMIQGIRDSLTILERWEWIREVYISPFPREWIQRFTDACIAPKVVFLRTELKEWRKRIGQFPTYGEVLRCLFHLEQDFSPQVEQVISIVMESHLETESLLEDLSDFACELAKRLNQEYKDKISARIALDLADLWGNTPSLRYRIEIEKKNLR